MTTKTAMPTKATSSPNLTPLPKTAPPKKGGSLLFPSDPLAAMRELSNLDSVREEAADALTSLKEYAEKNTEKNTYLHAENYAQENADNNTELNADTKAEILADSYAATNTELHLPRRVQKRKAVMPEGKPEIHTPNHTTDHTANYGTGHTSVRQRIIEDMTKEPVVRKTIDIPASLNDRLQDYCAAKRIKTERRVFLVLLENFLEEEGF